MPSLHTSLRSIMNGRDFSEVSDLGSLLTAIQNDSRLGFSLVSFVRQAISVREQWMSDNCGRGRLCDCVDCWPRDFLLHPFSAEELPADFEQSFLDGKPFLFF